VGGRGGGGGGGEPKSVGSGELGDRPGCPASKATLSLVKCDLYNFRSSTLKVVISSLLESLCSVELPLWLLKMLAPVYVHVLNFVAIVTQCFFFYVMTLSIYCTVRRTLQLTTQRHKRMYRLNTRTHVLKNVRKGCEKALWEILWYALNYFMYFFFIWPNSPPFGQGLLFHEVSRSHSTTHHSR
jgi:hypothetical protein